MKTNALGASGLQVSEICLGTMTRGEQNSGAEIETINALCPSPCAQ